MSVSLMGVVWSLQLDHAKRMIMLSLADHADDDGQNVFPSVAYTAWKTGYSERQVRRIIRTLQAEGLLIEVAASTPRRPTEYRIDVSAGVMKVPFGQLKLGADILSPRQGGHSDPPGGTSGPPRADIAMSAESSKEPSEEPQPPDPLSRGNDFEAERAKAREQLREIADHRAPKDDRERDDDAVREARRRRRIGRAKAELADRDAAA